MALDRPHPRNPMRPRRFQQLLWLVMITGLTACDNVAFGGVQVELQPPERSSTVPAEEVGDAVADEEEPLDPVELDPLVYVVQRIGGSRATILPVAQYSDGEYRAMPDTGAIPGLMERFSLGRWEVGAEFALLAHGSRVGTLVADGTTAADRSTCQLRPLGAGYVEMRPEAADSEWFLAVPAPRSTAREPFVTLPPLTPNGPLRDASLNLAQRMIPALDVLWPPSIPEIQRDLQPFSMAMADGSALAVSFVYGDQLSVGPTNQRAYSLFMLATEGETPGRYDPLVTWYQPVSAQKAFPRFIGAHDVRGVGTPDAVVQVYGETLQWYSILGADDGDWSELYVDNCGEPASRGAIRTYP